MLATNRKDLVRLSRACHVMATDAISRSGTGYSDDSIARHGAVLLEHCLRQGIDPKDIEKKEGDDT